MVIHIVEDAVKKLPNKGDRPALRLKTKPLSLSIASFVLPTTSALRIKPRRVSRKKLCFRQRINLAVNDLYTLRVVKCASSLILYVNKSHPNMPSQSSIFVISYQESNQHKLFTPKFLLICVDFQILYSFSYYHHPV